MVGHLLFGPAFISDEFVKYYVKLDKKLVLLVNLLEVIFLNENGLYDRLFVGWLLIIGRLLFILLARSALIVN